MAIHVPHLMSQYEAWSLAAQWVSAGAAVAAVLVAALFGALTLANSRRSKDADQRAQAALLATDNAPDFTASYRRGLHGPPWVEWRVAKTQATSRWRLTNVGQATATDFRISGLTDQDKDRLRVADPPSEIEPGGSMTFLLMGFWGAAEVATAVVSWKYEGEDEEFTERIPLVEP